MPVTIMMHASAIDYTGRANPDLWQRFAAIYLDGMRTDRSEPSRLPVPGLTPEEYVAAMAGGRPKGP